MSFEAVRPRQFDFDRTIYTIRYFFLRNNNSWIMTSPH